MNEKEICPLCRREIAEPANLHHLIPVSKGGRHGPTILMHQICHNKLHSLFTEKELARQYNNIEDLLKHEDVICFVKWISKKPPGYYDRNRQATRKKNAKKRR